MCDTLTGITIERVDCLNAFIMCRKLVNWLRESMGGSGLKELKVFVDLAIMSAGEEPINCARVQCLHTAVTGFAPLIFDLEEESGYRDLLKQCSVVWKELENNKDLPRKLIDTNRHLDWLKEIKNAHGSVEVTSLMQAELINETGTYYIGKNVWKISGHEKVSTEGGMLISDVLTLKVPDKKKSKVTIQKGSYTFTELQDLQSRLMLVAGQADKTMECVDIFTSVFDSLTRLSNVYIKLWSSGCLLFKDFSATFRCNIDQPVCISLAFGEGKDSPILKGTRLVGKEDLKEMVPDVAKFMENCHEEWLHHFKQKRKLFLHLNFFTVDQLVILQRELVKIGREEPSHLIYPLLAAVKKDCSPDDLIKAMIAAKKEITEINSNVSCGKENAKPEADKKDTDQLHDINQTFIDKMIAAGYNEGLALKALKHVEPTDVSKGMEWCMENDEDVDNDDEYTEQEETITENERNANQVPIFIGWSESTTDIQTLIKRQIDGIKELSDVGSAPLINELGLLWKMFLESISSNIRDYLSLEDLGFILKHLAAKNTQDIHRSLAPGFGLVEGQPNLIVCPSVDVLMTTLTMYVNQPLPLSDEVLLCSPKTSKDEVDIFLRRALFDGGEKIHCLVNADMLDYDVSEAAEKYLEEHLLEVPEDSKYRLIVLCGSDNEYRSGIVSSLDKFKCQSLPINMHHLREYLANKLKVLEEHGEIKPAASVDRERSTVRVVKSWRAGVGKSLYKQRREEELSSLNKSSIRSEAVSIPLQEKIIDLHYVIGKLQEHATIPGQNAARIFHIDISYEVQSGVDYLLFSLLILDCLMDTTGYVWRRSRNDIYLIETMPLMVTNPNIRGGRLQYYHTMLAILPDLTCRSPLESLNIYHGNKPKEFKDLDQLFDEKQFHSPVFQRPFQYLMRLDEGRPLIAVNSELPQETTRTCLTTLLKHCGLEDPSWLELHHFVWFLNTQLVDYERNSFVSVAAAQDLPGFAKFVLLFLIQMSRDFSTRSLNMSEESPTLKMTDGESSIGSEEEGMTRFVTNNNIRTFQMKRTWESSPHPYLFFNTDGFTFTFLGFNIERTSGNLIDLQTGHILEKGIMAQNLYDALIRNQVNLQEDFDALKRDDKLRKLCNVMGVKYDPEQPAPDPDDTYELTTDNVKKILAIYMRFRCDIPVIIMGETGCGKTRLVKFMCALQVPEGDNIANMILMKVHGGTTKKDIIEKVREAEEKAKENKKTYGDHMFTVLFFDEANTTEAIGLIKEIMCDKCVNGEKLTLCENLKMVAACNPYRKHSDELIKKLEQSGLGYHVDADETTDRFGRVPMRRLVYRVQPLPQSLLPMVWDFGQLNTQVEDLYIRQMVKRYIREKKLPNITCLKEVVSAILTASQAYMRQQEDECSFVSLRDVDRVLTVMNWFSVQSQGERTLYNMMDIKFGRQEYDEDEDDDEDNEQIAEKTDSVDDLTRSLILALGVCYHACLKTRSKYREEISQYFRAPCELPGGPDQIKQEIECCQEVFLDNVHLGKNIARNMALKENVFMMVVCIELRIPLFLVGKPGSSKSLAKTIVSDAMQGNAAREKLFKELKQVQVVSFQCSPLSTPDGIVGTFRQCAQFQKDKDLDTFVSIVVLDEVGLAEDSPRMPLKTLHPLLEDGCQGNEKPEKYKKVAFIGISNWALDPAKMNRGILVQREVPDLVELQNTASGICKTNEQLYSFIESLIEPMAQSYLDIFKEASQRMREFYGLRDFYSLVKMVYSFVENSRRPPTWNEMQHAILRNFGGFDLVNPEHSFKQNLLLELPAGPAYLDNSPSGLIQACLFGPKRSVTGPQMQSDTTSPSIESRYLLLLTENYGALAIIQQKILSRGKDIKPITIFGSSFRSDQEYTQVCRNINKIKGCMETGNTVVLLNLENLYESLYDALNQYYVYFGGERYVDLGLGTHRVKCPVHKNFRLIVVAERQTVYKKFPIPLINRLEKHFLTINTMLKSGQQDVSHRLEEWVNSFVEIRRTDTTQSETLTKVGDVFIGYHDDTCSAIVLDVWDKLQIPDNEDTNADSNDTLKEVLETCKYELLRCATPESLFRLKHSNLPSQEQESLKRQYFEKQTHDSLIQFLQYEICGHDNRQLRSQVTTHSKLMASVHKDEIGKAIGIATEKILLLETLSSFETEQQFTNRIKDHIKKTETDPSLMIIQCDCGDVNANLIACARYCVRDELQKIKDDGGRAPLHVLFIIQLPRGANFTGLQRGVWHSVHIDDLYPEDLNMPTLQGMQGKSVAGIFRDAVTKTVQSETNKDISQEKRLNVKGLVLRCVPPALSMVKNKDGNTAREMYRVSFVRTMLHKEHDQDKNTFFHGVCCLLQKLLMEKEQKTHNASYAQNWMINEAASNDNISKAGTFRRSCLQALEVKVYPVLAGIIAFLDTNENLSLLDDKQAKWKLELWLAYINNTDALSLQYTDLMSPTKRSDLQEVEVVSTGCEGHVFSARMPFSWLLISKINELFTFHFSKEESHETEVRVLYDHPLGRELATISDEKAVSEATAAYIHDYVHTVYKAETDQEYQLVIQLIQDEVTKRISQQTVESNLLQKIVHVHLSYQTFATRLPYFRAINNIWPDCSSVIVERRKRPDHYIFQDQDFTFSALKLLMEDLAPEIEALNRPKGRDEWLDKVHKCRPVVEKVISLYAEDQTIDISFRQKSVLKARTMWSHIVVVKLYFEHLCTATMNKKVINTFCSSLWAKLQTADLKTSLTELEAFLDSYNQKAMKDNGFSGSCLSCNKTLTTPPLTLPCSDIVCDLCASEMDDTNVKMCPKCKKDFPEDWKYIQQLENTDALEKMKDSQKRCNTFFMDVVSQLCFADNIAPSQDVVHKLLEYIFFTTKGQHQYTREFTIFKTGKGLDPNPVFRSFLLQLLARTSEEDLKENLKLYLEQAEPYIKTEAADQSQQYVELSVLVIQCLEDMFTLDANKTESDEVVYATNALKKSKSNIRDKNLSVEKLYCLANARMGLSVLAKCLARTVTDRVPEKDETEISVVIDSSVINLTQAAQQLFQETDIHYIRSYFVKVLCNTYSIHSYKTICRNPNPAIEWINFMDIGKVVELADRFIVCGEEYMAVREALTKFVNGTDKEVLIRTVQESHERRVQIETMVQLAVFREITCSNLYSEQKGKIAARTVQEFFISCNVFRNTDLLQALLNNQLKPRHLVVKEGADLRLQGIQCLVVHFIAVMTQVDGSLTLLLPLKSLMETPQICAEMFLPTMPQDDLEEIKAMFPSVETVYTGEKLLHFQIGNDIVVFYRCPNGHPYSIGECGRAWTTSKCNKCGAEIGGTVHNLLSQNKKDADSVAMKETGHILGSANVGVQVQVAERTMTPATCAILRLFVHLSMYASAGENLEGIQSIITPEIETDQVEEFLWAHIQQDIGNIYRALGRSEDDVLLLMHTLIHNIMTKRHEVGEMPEEVCRLSSKNGREQWEKEFSSKFVQESLQNLQITLQSKSSLLAKDERLGVDLLQCMLCETDDQSKNEHVDRLEEIPRVWRFRIPISLAHLRQSLPSDHYKVLQLFLQEERYLRALRYIPSILRLHRVLFQKYQRRLDKTEASLITVAQLRKESDAVGGEMRQLILDFAEAWELVRHALISYTCPTDFGMMAVSKKLCYKAINDNTPISSLLPTTKEAGLCSYALLDFLFRKQNEFLDNYLKETKRKTSSISMVKPRDVTSAHLISYDPQHDIKPLLLANCQYSIEIGKGTKIEYDFAGLERQFMDRFLFSKSRIDIGKVLQIDLMVYRTEFTNADVFTKLNGKIEQDVLSTVVKTQICTESRSLPDVCQSLDNLDITISFLTSTGGQPDRSLHLFMSETLQMETTIHSPKAQQACEFKHIKSLWLLLSYHKSKMMTDSRQQPAAVFESVSAEFHDDLPDELKEQFKDFAMKKLTVDKLSQLLEVLHEYILLVVAVRHNANDEDYIDTRNHELWKWLPAYADDLDFEILDDFPKEILYRHSVYTWIYAYRHLKEKNTGNAQN